LDPSLIQAIWNDSFNYDASFEILTSLAKEADQTLDQEIASSVDQLDLTDTTSSVSLSESEDENVTFLLTCFPTVPMEELVEALRSQDNDVEKVTDILLSKEFIQQNQVDDGPRQFPAAKKKPKPKNTIWSSGQLPTVSASQGHTTNPVATANNMRRIMEKEEELKNNKEYTELASVPFNFWHQYDKTVSDLQRYFPRVAQMNIAACVQRCRGNVIASTKLLMERHPNEKPEHELSWPEVKTLDDLKSSLSIIMVDRTPLDVARVALGVIVHDAHKTPDQLVQTGVEHFLTFDISQVELEARLKKMAAESEMLRAKAKKREIPVIPEYLLINNEDTYNEDDADACRDMAMELILERNELFKKAASAYRQAKNKGPGEGGVAFYYSDTARQIDEQAKDWNLRAARATVRSHRIKQQDDHLLDLHGLTVAEAQTVIKEGVTQWYSRSQMQAGKKINNISILRGGS
jgi:hypothetical protein